jgi:hypothetical protein
LDRPAWQNKKRVLQPSRDGRHFCCAPTGLQKASGGPSEVNKTNDWDGRKQSLRRTSMRFSAFLAAISAILSAITPASFDEDRDYPVARPADQKARPALSLAGAK